MRSPSDAGISSCATKRLVSATGSPAGSNPRHGDRLHIWYSRVKESVAYQHAADGFRAPDDILTLIDQARSKGDLDEAVWRSFLAAHFGRLSANFDQMGSATRLFFGFGKEPRWTWTAVSANSSRFRAWLLAHERELQGLLFGNHRKFEAKKPDLLWGVIDSFLGLVRRSGGAPSKLIEVTPLAQTPEQRFDILFRRIASIERFGRTGAFDFVDLLAEMNLTDARPGSLYLEGSTGPLDGARLLWPNLDVPDLERKSVALARDLGVSTSVLEDTLCNWQKRYDKPEGSHSS